MSEAAHQCDIVLPVYNGLNYVRECVESVLRYTPQGLYQLFLMDDASDAATRGYLADIASQHAHITHIRNERNLGFLQNCNKGMALGHAPFTLLLNSDVIVSPRWLEKMLACASSDARIASVNPFTNYAANIALPMVPGTSFLDMNGYLERHAPKSYPDIVTGVGFCLLLRRVALEEVGLFDEMYGAGYCEESDLCMRLTAHGWRTVVADDTYVYHKGRASFDNRDERYFTNRQLFDERWSAEYKRQYAEFRRKAPLKPIHTLFADQDMRWAPLPFMRSAFRQMRQCYQQRDYPGVVKTAIKQTLRLPSAKRPVPTARSLEKYAEPGRLRVTYVLPTLGIAGGVLSVTQLVNELTLLGVEARIAAIYEDDAVYGWKMLSRPLVYNSFSELVEKLPETDILVATHWKTAKSVQQLVDNGRAKTAAYFLQDYEAWFYPEQDAKSRQKVVDSYRLVGNKIVKSDWLAGMLAKDGYDTHKIRLGMDLGVFYPRRKEAAGAKPVVMAMARPSTPRRGYDYVVQALEAVHKARPDAEIILFGDKINQALLGFPCTSTGSISNQRELAELYSRADVFLDGSTFQGFGRPALEGMACGCACVLTHAGGVNEYAKDGENCLLVPPRDPQAFSDAILHLLENDDLRARLVESGQRTARDYCHRREARETLAFFRQLADEPLRLKKTG